MKSKELINQLVESFKNDLSFAIEEFKTKQNDYKIIYLKGCVDNTLLIEMIVKPLNEDEKIYAFETQEFNDLETTITNLIKGHVVVVTNNIVTLVNCQMIHLRGIEEPDNEKTLNGAKEGFIESIITNMALVRQKMPNPNLKFKHLTLGENIKTDVVIGYLDGVVENELLLLVEERLKKIKLEGIYDAHYIIELIKDSPRSFFNTVGETERPDSFCAKLLEGGVGIIVNGSPLTILLPFLFAENFKSNDDYFTNYYYASFSRFIRYLAFLITICAPSFYIVLVAYHHELVPTFLALNIAASSSAVPMTAVMECILFIILFEILREAGLRMPSKVGQALSIVGALIIGQSAVEAKIVSAPIIIVVAITAVCGFMTPKLNTLTGFLRLFMLLASCFFGMYGLLIVLLIFTIKLFSIDSYGVQYSGNFFTLSLSKLKDSFIRAPFNKFDKNKKLKSRRKK